MGKHFDDLVEFTRKHADEREVFPRGPLFEPYFGGISSVKKYLEDVLNRVSLFEFPLQAEDIFPRSGKDHTDYRDYIRNYFDMSAEYNSVFLTPFNLTAVEDKTSVVILDKRQDNKYIVTNCISAERPITGLPEKFTQAALGTLTLGRPNTDGLIPQEIIPVFSAAVYKGEIVLAPPQGLDDACAQDLSSATTSYIEEVIYIMDPSNFIIYKENTASRQYREKQEKRAQTGKKPVDIICKTVMRPHYICLSEEDTSAFLKHESKEPRPAHPVRGHWRNLMSEKWTKKKGQRIYIAQYFTGQGQVDAPGGWTYKVMVKESPDKIIPYDQVQ